MGTIILSAGSWEIQSDTDTDTPSCRGMYAVCREDGWMGRVHNAQDTENALGFIWTPAEILVEWHESAPAQALSLTDAMRVGYAIAYWAMAGRYRTNPSLVGRMMAEELLMLMENIPNTPESDAAIDAYFSEWTEWANT